jgi:hypothetical protein
MGAAQGNAFRAEVHGAYETLRDIEPFRLRQPWWLPFGLFRHLAARKASGFAAPATAAPLSRLWHRAYVSIGKNFIDRDQGVLMSAHKPKLNGYANSCSVKVGISCHTSGHGSGANCPCGSGRPLTRAASHSAGPTTNSRGCRGARRRGRGSVAPTSPRVSFRASPSTVAPMTTNHRIVTANASHNRSARSGLVIRVYCHGKAPLLMTLKPCSIQARKAYQHGDAAPSGRSISTSQGSS